MNSFINIQLFGGRGAGSSNRYYRGNPTLIHSGRQGKHIPGHNNFQQGKSEITISPGKQQELVNKFAGKGKLLPNGNERVNFGETIGRWLDPQSGKYYDTSWGIIHWSKYGPHIVPASPFQN